MNGQVPVLGQAPTREQAAQMAIMQSLNQLSLALYTNLATTEIARLDSYQELDRDRLKDLAKSSSEAAKAYFEGLGIAQFND